MRQMHDSQLKQEWSFLLRMHHNESIQLPQEPNEIL